MADRIIAYIRGEMEEVNDPFQDDLTDDVKKSLDRPSKPLKTNDDAEDDKSEKDD